MQDIRSFLETLSHWAKAQPDIRAVTLVGSFARGAAPWLNTFGQVASITDEDWGMVQSRRTFYSDGFEIEFSITTPQWASIDPLDEGTRRVIADGAQIIYDPDSIAAALIQAVEAR
jgi:hypothetical protein